MCHFDPLANFYFLEKDCTEKGGLHASGKCFIVPYLSPSRNLNYERAVAECAKQEALLVEIYDLPQQNAVYDFVQGKMATDWSYVQVWMGMQYNTTVSRHQAFPLDTQPSCREADSV